MTTPQLDQLRQRSIGTPLPVHQHQLDEVNELPIKPTLDGKAGMTQLLIGGGGGIAGIVGAVMMLTQFGFLPSKSEFDSLAKSVDAMVVRFDRLETMIASTNAQLIRMEDLKEDVDDLEDRLRVLEKLPR